MTFDEGVAEWLRGKGYTVERVTSVDGYGTDWQGDTDHGFESAFSTEISWVAPNGRAGSFTAEGDDMESLWKHVVGSWPGGA